MKAVFFVLALTLLGCSSVDPTVMLEETHPIYENHLNAVVGELISVRDHNDIVCPSFYFNISYDVYKEVKKIYVAACEEFVYYDTPGLIGHRVYRDGTVEEVQDYD